MKRLSLVYREGVSTSNSSIGGVGLAGGHLAVAHGSAKGVHQTLLSRQFAPPTKKSLVWPVIGMVLCGSGLLGVIAAIAQPASNATSDAGAQNVMLTIALIYGGLLFLSVRAYRSRVHNNREQPRQLMKWENSFMCGRCGDLFTPG